MPSSPLLLFRTMVRHIVKKAAPQKEFSIMQNPAGGLVLTLGKEKDQLAIAQEDISDLQLLRFDPEEYPKMSDLKKGVSFRFVLNISSNDSNCIFLFTSARPEIRDMLTILQYLKLARFTNRLYPLFLSAVCNISPGPSAPLTTNLPLITWATDACFYNVVPCLAEFVDDAATTQLQLHDALHISNWPILVLYVSLLLVLLAVGPYSEKSFTIGHLLNMKTSNLCYLLPYISVVRLRCTSFVSPKPIAGTPPAYPEPPAEQPDPGSKLAHRRISKQFRQHPVEALGTPSESEPARLPEALRPASSHLSFLDHKIVAVNLLDTKTYERIAAEIAAEAQRSKVAMVVSPRPSVSKQSYALSLEVNVHSVAYYIFHLAEFRFHEGYFIPHELSRPLYGTGTMLQAHCGAKLRPLTGSDILNTYNVSMLHSLVFDQGGFCDILSAIPPVMLLTLQPVSVQIRCAVSAAVGFCHDRLHDFAFFQCFKIADYVWTAIRAYGLQRLRADYDGLQGLQGLQGLPVPTAPATPASAVLAEEGAAAAAGTAAGAAAPGRTPERKFVLNFDEGDADSFSVFFSQQLYDGDIEGLLYNSEISKAATLQSMYAFLFLPSPRADAPLLFNGNFVFPSLVRYINPDGSLADICELTCTDELDLDIRDVKLSPLISGSLLHILLKAILNILRCGTPQVPSAIHELLASATINIRVNYGQPSETTCENDNIVSEFFLDDKRSGGGGAELFLDAPGVLSPLAHFFLASPAPDAIVHSIDTSADGAATAVSDPGILAVFEYWLRVGVKGFPPICGISPSFFAGSLDAPLDPQECLLPESNQRPATAAVRCVPEQPVIMLDINCLPSSRQAFLGLPQDYDSKRIGNEVVVREYYTKYSEKSINISIDEALTESDRMYYFIQRVPPTRLFVGGGPDRAYQPRLLKLPHNFIHVSEALAPEEASQEIGAGEFLVPPAFVGMASAAEAGTADGGTPASDALDAADVAANAASAVAAAATIGARLGRDGSEAFRRDASSGSFDAALLSARSLDGPAICNYVETGRFTRATFVDTLSKLCIACLVRACVHHLASFARYMIAVRLSGIYHKTNALSVLPREDHTEIMALTHDIFTTDAQQRRTTAEMLRAMRQHPLSLDVYRLITSKLGVRPTVVSRATVFRRDVYPASLYAKPDAAPRPRGLRLQTPERFYYGATVHLDQFDPEQVIRRFSDELEWQYHSNQYVASYGNYEIPQFSRPARQICARHSLIMRELQDVLQRREVRNYQELASRLYQITKRHLYDFYSHDDVFRCEGPDNSVFTGTLHSLLSTCYSMKLVQDLHAFVAPRVSATAHMPPHRYTPASTFRRVQGIAVPWCSVRSFYPEMLLLPSFTLHPFAPNDYRCDLAVDMGFVPHYARNALMLFLTSALPRFLSELRRAVIAATTVDIIDGVSSKGRLHTTARSGPAVTNQRLYRSLMSRTNSDYGSVWLSPLLYDVFDISRVVVTAAAYDEPVVSLSGGANYLVLRCLEVSYAHVNASAAAADDGPQSAAQATIAEAISPALVGEMASFFGCIVDSGADAGAGLGGTDGDSMGSVGDSALEDSGCPRATKTLSHSNPFDNLLTFSILDPQVVFEYLSRTLRLNLVRNLVCAARTIQQCLTAAISSETIVKIPARFVSNEGSAGDGSLATLAARLAVSTLRCDFENLPGISLPVRRHLYRIMNTCSSLLFGFSERLNITVAPAKMGGSRAENGRVTIYVDHSRPLDYLLPPFSLADVPPDVLPGSIEYLMFHVQALNPHLNPLHIGESTPIRLYSYKSIDESLAYGFCTLSAQRSDYLTVLILPNELFSHPDAGRFIDRAHCSNGAVVIFADSDEFQDLCLSIELPYETVHWYGPSLNLDVPAIGTFIDSVTERLSSADASIVRMLMHAHSTIAARAHALRFACKDISSIFGFGARTYMFPNSFGLVSPSAADFALASASVDYAIFLANNMERTKIFPLTLRYLLTLTDDYDYIEYDFAADTASRNFLPFNLLLVGPLPCAVPASIAPTRYACDFLLATDPKEVGAMIDRGIDGDSEAALLGLVPLTICDYRSFYYINDASAEGPRGGAPCSTPGDVQGAAQDAAGDPAGGSAQEAHIFSAAPLEATAISFVDRLFGTEFSDYSYSSVVADDCVFGPFILLSTDQRVWTRLVQAIMQSSLRSYFRRYFIGASRLKFYDKPIRSEQDMCALLPVFLISWKIRNIINRKKGRFDQYIEFRSRP